MAQKQDMAKDCKYIWTNGIIWEENKVFLRRKNRGKDEHGLIHITSFWNEKKQQF